VLAYLENDHIDTSKIKLVVNRYNRETGLNSDLIPKAAGCEVCLVIPSENELVQKSLMEGKPIPPGSSAGKALSSLAGKVIGVCEKGPEARKTPSRGLFSAIFSR
jgi:Flp pilus assembly CpaE family ATPase